MKNMEIIKRILTWNFWEYGTCRDRIAKRHLITGIVKFVLWKAGEHGHKKDYWHMFDPSWWHLFEITPEVR